MTNSKPGFTSFGVDRPFLFSDMSAEALTSETRDFVDTLLSQHIARRTGDDLDPRNGTLAGLTAAVYVLLAPGALYPASALAVALQAATQKLEEEGYTVLSLSPTNGNLADLIDDEDVPYPTFSTRGADYIAGWRLVIAKKADLDHFATDLDEDDDPRYAYFWTRELARERQAAHAAAATDILKRIGSPASMQA